MIVTKLMGGHSNQLFQYATGRSLAIKRGTDLFLDKSWFSNIDEKDTPRDFELDVYPIKAKEVDITKLEVRSTDTPPSLLERSKHRLGIDKRLWPIYEQPGINQTLMTAANNSLLVGWWQNEIYFIDIRDKLVKEFEPSSELSEKNQKLIDRMKHTESVWMHIRRGDYVTNKYANKHHGVKGADYYQKALEYLTKKLPNSNLDKLEIFICSNDIPWCKNNLKFPYPIHFVENKLGSDDMRVVKHCKHDILANSSFSWWGAWLNEYPDKIVIAPKIWFQDQEAESQTDIVPKNWIRI